MFDTPTRELHPGEGRWLSPDPAGAGWNLYAYASSNPLSFIDPSGLCPDCDTSHYESLDSMGLQPSCFGGPGCTTYMINGMPVSSAAFNAAGGSGLQWAFTLGPPTNGNLGSLGSWTYNPQSSWSVATTIYSEGNQIGDPSYAFGIENGGWQFTPAPLAGGAANNEIPIVEEPGRPGPNIDEQVANNNARSLARAVNATGVQTLQNPCTIGLIYAIPAGGAATATVDSVGVLATLETWGVPATAGLTMLYRLNPARIAATVGNGLQKIGNAIRNGCGW